jgi:hypothetical protein
MEDAIAVDAGGEAAPSTYMRLKCSGITVYRN